MAMGAPYRKAAPRLPSYLLPSIICLVSLTAFFLYQVDRFASETKTIAGHNLDPTPWHIFPPKTFNEQTRHGRAYTIIQCSYLTCTTSSQQLPSRISSQNSQTNAHCPDFFRFIHRDLEPWAQSGVTMDHLMEAKNFAAFRVVIFKGKLYLDLYYACVQSRMMFTIWGLLQMIERYPGLVPDVDLMFDCMDRPNINRTEHSSFPLPIFRYCTTKDHFDIPFPDWSFWGWPEINIRPWNEEFPDIKRGSQSQSWSKRKPRAFWKGNPDVMSEIRTELLQCNNSRKFGALIMRQDWGEEARIGFERSKLSNQCDYRYKIYAEGFAWSVSLKYIIACGSLTLIITPKYEDFFSRGLIPKKNYWPVSSDQLCRNIKYAVEWGNANPVEASSIGKGGQDLMESLSMDRVYDYMFHLIKKYAELLKFKPVPPQNARQVCGESILCFGDEKQKEYLKKSSTSPSSPCNLQPADANLIQSLLQEKERVIKDVKNMAMPKGKHN
ncbi:uncharacterized protein [Euphorbia lathyris]|uniref:uncharacterized protein n=1 Tax=Euphorbia lathyris TaxID=212925 RepID=UPI003313DBD4